MFEYVITTERVDNEREVEGTLPPRSLASVIGE